MVNPVLLTFHCIFALIIGILAVIPPVIPFTLAIQEHSGYNGNETLVSNETMATVTQPIGQHNGSLVNSGNETLSLPEKKDSPSGPPYQVIVGGIVVLLIISVLIIVIVKRRSSGPPGSETNDEMDDETNDKIDDVASTTVVAASEHDLKKGNVDSCDDKGESEEQAALMNSQV